MDNVLSLLGLAYRAKKIVLGETCLEKISKVKFLFIASDASDKTKERYLKKCEYYNIPHTSEYDCASISMSLGKNNTKIVGVIDKGFTEAIKRKI